LLNALEDFTGTIIIVSHDRFFLDSLATKILAIENGRAVVYEGNYSQYLWAKSRRDLSGSESDNDDGGVVQVTDRKQQAREDIKQQKQLNNRLQKLKREIEENEKQIAGFERLLAEVEAQLASPPLEWSPTRVAEVAQSHAELNARLESAMSAWEALHLENEQTAAELARLKEGAANGAE